jgi:DNA-directed RNA polymerase specialized sigma24 family protein
MQKRLSVSASTDPIGQLLEDYYDQFVEWANHLTRGDEARAQDLVHDFCLHLAVAQPDLSSISSLDGYLYKSLRNIYLSILARSSREALQTLSVVDYDSMQLAFAPRGTGDLLQLQNDLRSICSYSLWRKDYTKIASYFILRFFHGYQQHEIAEMARSPITVLYAKLREFRIEMRAYLRDSGKIRLLGQDKPPVPIYRKDLVSSMELFQELLRTIHGAKSGDCLPEEALIERYNSTAAKPLSTSFLSHVVSCERCLNVIDRFFDRPTQDKRGPLDDQDVRCEAGAHRSRAAKNMRARVLASVQRLRTEILEHRPRILSIAVDGKIVASHTIQSQRDVLTARVERPSETGFIEVFSEQGVRLAQLSMDPLPPEGPHQRLQHVDLTDDRWLELQLTFDGLGVGCEAVYFDAALSAGWVLKDDAEELFALRPYEQRWSAERTRQAARAKIVRWLAAAQKTLRPIAPSPVFAWALSIAAAGGVTGYFVLHDGKAGSALRARDVLSRSVNAEQASLKGKTEHEVLLFEETSAQGEVREQGTIDLWRDGDGKRHIRRFFDANHHMLAAEWEQSDGRQGEFSGTKQGTNSDALTDDLWKQNLSVSAYRVSNEDDAHVRPVNDGYELTIMGPDTAHPELISATLTFDRNLHPIREVLRVRRGDQIRVARFIQADYEQRSSSDVPDRIFAPPAASLESNYKKRLESSPRPAGGRPVASNVELSQLYIAVLYQLSNLNADTSDPIEVERTAEGRIRVEGVLPDERRRQEVLASLNGIKDRRILEVHLISQSNAAKKRAARAQAITETVSSFNVDQAEAPADAALRAVFQARGMSGPMLDEAVRGFSRDILTHAQTALQHASILNRLGSGIDTSVLRKVDFESQERWTKLVARHANALDIELQAINKQLDQISSFRPDRIAEEKLYPLVQNPQQFAKQANQLLIEVQNLNRTAGNIFAVGHAVNTKFTDIESLVAATRKSIPLGEAAEIKKFAVELNASETTASLNRWQNRQDTRSY